MYSNVYGPRQDSSGEGGVVSIFCENILKGISPHIYGDGNQTRDFVYVKDVANANLLSVGFGKTGIYNVSTNKSTTINEVFKKINALSYKDVSAIYCKQREGDILNSYMSYNKLLLAMNWKPKYSLTSGLKETLKFYNSK